jgi:hypothetical protein
VSEVSIVRHCSVWGKPTEKWDELYIWCPACDDLHGLPVTGDGTKRPTWNWNGDLVNVTVEPSILSNYGVINGKSRICHSFLRNGEWEFLGDCTHELAGKKVPMVPLPEWILRERASDA